MSKAIFHGSMLSNSLSDIATSSAIFSNPSSNSSIRTLASSPIETSNHSPLPAHNIESRLPWYRILTLSRRARVFHWLNWLLMIYTCLHFIDDLGWLLQTASLNDKFSKQTDYRANTITKAVKKPLISMSTHLPQFRNETDHWTKTIDQNLLMSKVFQTALKPTKIVPYFFKARFDTAVHHNITVTTLITIERLSKLEHLVNTWKGPISVVMHVKEKDEQYVKLLPLYELYNSSIPFQYWVDLHLIVDNYDRQFNMWRNAARLFARTPAILMLDVDFRLCTDFRAKIFDSTSSVYAHHWDGLLKGEKVLVLPAFEYTRKGLDLKMNSNTSQVSTLLDSWEGRPNLLVSRPAHYLANKTMLSKTTSLSELLPSFLDFPTTKAQAIDLMRQKLLDSFHSLWRRGHGPTGDSIDHDSLYHFLKMCIDTLQIDNDL